MEIVKSENLSKLSSSILYSLKNEDEEQTNKNSASESAENSKMDKVELGQSSNKLIDRVEFKEVKGTHVYEFEVQAGQYIEVNAKPIGDDLNLRLKIFNPVGGLIYQEKEWNNQRGSANIKYKSKKLGANGKYKIQILNWYRNPGNGSAEGAGIGVYDISIEAKEL